VVTEQTEQVEEAKPFDVHAHMGKIRTRNGMQNYLGVKWRILWLLSEHPQAQIITEKVGGGIPDGFAEFKCIINLPGGRVATGHGSETRDDFPDFYEKAETKSIGRALAAAGFGTDAAPDLDDDEPMDGLGAAKHERRDRRHMEQEERTERAPVALSADPNGVATSGQMNALKRFAHNGFDVAAYVQKEFGKNIPELTFAEAGKVITEAQKK